MIAANKASRVLGVAFLLQAITSLASGLIMKLALTVPGNISESMINIANKPWLMRTNILGEMITAFGIIFLGAVLFVILRKHNEKIALTALGLYILEAVLLVMSRLQAFSLLRISQEYVATGHHAYLETLGKLALESMDYAYSLLMFPFAVGAVLFYYLLDKSRIVPRFLSLWGLITTVCPCLIATLFVIFGYKVPFACYLPYAPFEFVIGVWILVKGIRDDSEAVNHLAANAKSQ